MAKKKNKRKTNLVGMEWGCVWGYRERYTHTRIDIYTHHIIYIIICRSIKRRKRKRGEWWWGTLTKNKKKKWKRRKNTPHREKYIIIIILRRENQFTRKLKGKKRRNSIRSGWKERKFSFLCTNDIDCRYFSSSLF